MKFGACLLGRLTGSIAALLLMVASAQAAGPTLNISDAGFDPIPAGGRIEYSVRLQNGDNTPTAPDTLNFAIPAGTTYVGISGDLSGCSPAPDQVGPVTISCPVPSLTPLQQLQAVVRVVPSASGVITFSGTLVVSGTTVPQKTTVIEGADLDLSFTAPADVRAGDILDFSAVVTNNGPYPAASTRVTMLLPATLSDNIVLPPNCAISGNEVTCQITGPVAVGDSVSVDFQTRAVTGDGSNVAVAGSLSDSAPADPDLSNDAASFNIRIDPGTDVRLQKARSPSGLVFVGQEVEFTLTPAFTGNAPVEATITDDLPANYELISTSPTGAGWTCNSVNPVSCSYADAAGNGAEFVKPIIIRAMPVVATPTGIPVANTAHIESPDDVITANNSASDGGADIVEPAIDLVAVKTGPPHGLVAVGNEYDWQIRARNDGNVGFAGRLILTDSLPVGLELTNISAPAGWICAPATAIGPADITCSSDNYTEASPLAVGASSPAIILTSKVLQVGTIGNTLLVETENENFPDRDLSNNETTVNVESGDDNTPDHLVAGDVSIACWQPELIQGSL